MTVPGRLGEASEGRSPRSPRAPAPPALELAEVTKVFTLESGERVRAVDRLSLTVDRGEFVCVVGPSGHGKSTLLHLIAGFDKPTAGTVASQGEPVTGPGADRGVVFQADTVFMWRRVADNVAYGLKARGVPKPERDATVARLLDVVGLTRFARAWPKQLSGGMRRRVAIATVFANEPDILLMDEPFTGLDDARRTALHQVLVDLWTSAGNTVFFVTHNLEEALTLATRLVVLVNGQIARDVRLGGRPPRDPQRLRFDEINDLRLDVIGLLQEAISATDDLE
jgi:NitT/TauT family transport system ATP-binding protein